MSRSSPNVLQPMPLAAAPVPEAANENAFQALSDAEVLVLGYDGNLWLEHGPFGTVPPPRQQVDGNVKAFQALTSTEILVLGHDGKLWLEHGPFGTVPPPRQQVDGNVKAFQAITSAEVLVLGTDGKLWLEQGPFGTVPPPPRQQVDGNVAAFQAVSATEVVVLGVDGKLWLEHGPFGTVPPLRQQIDGNVTAFQAISATEVVVLGVDRKLWLEHGPFGTVPPQRQQVDGNVTAFQAISATEALVLGTDAKLWLEHGPFGTVPPPRQQVDNKVAIGIPGFSSGDLSVTATSIVFSHHVDLEGLDVGSIQGPVGVTMNSDGSYNFTGQLNNSAYAPYNYSAVVALQSKSGAVFVFSVSRSIGSGLPLSNNNDQWDNSGHNPAIKAAWLDLQAGCKYFYRGAAIPDWQTLMADIQKAAGYIGTAVNVIASL
jgi:hypothetical protein